MKIKIEKMLNCGEISMYICHQHFLLNRNMRLIISFEMDLGNEGMQV